MHITDEVIVLMKLGRVPRGGVASKKTGHVKYRVVDALKILGGQPSSDRLLAARHGRRLLVNDYGVANSMSTETFVHWHALLHEVESLGD